MNEISVRRSDGVVTVTLNRPERKNAVTVAMWFELARMLAEAADRPEDRVLASTGTGGVFCAGGDLGAAADRDGPGEQTGTG